MPDPISYPLRAEAYTGITKNRGIPGFINDAMPDGWGERLLHRAYGQTLAPIEYLLKSPNNDRIGSLMAGTSPVPPAGLGESPVPSLKGLAKFVEACEAVYDNQLDEEAIRVLNLRQQRSSLGGARRWSAMAMTTREITQSSGLVDAGACRPCTTCFRF